MRLSNVSVFEAAKKSQTTSLKVTTRQSQSGFTLIELMIIITIVAILTSIAVPSYRQYTLRSQQAQTQADLEKLSSELDQWRTKALSYKGFEPRFIFEESENDNKQRAFRNLYSTSNEVKSPLGVGFDVAGTADGKERYTIKIQAIREGNSATAIDMANVSGSWIMIATPKNTTSGLLHYAMSSNGIKCASNTVLDPATVWNDNDCGSGERKWK